MCNKFICERYQRLRRAYEPSCNLNLIVFNNIDEVSFMVSTRVAPVNGQLSVSCFMTSIVSHKTIYCKIQYTLFAGWSLRLFIQ